MPLFFDHKDQQSEQNALVDRRQQYDVVRIEY
jgi:hypothetical protein